MLAPTEACTYLGSHGDAEVRAVPGIAGYRLYVRPGDRLSAGVMTRNLDMIWGRCADHAELSALKGDVLAALSYEFESPDGRRRIPATDLMRRPGRTQ
ncbi:hypothetical protein BFF78_01560 [Streptomyces fodineus]|uniref:Uncharacterized protein n=1 Tax=Streptomyces fodineus TaxID=1904616 RepID=A0A1D7Y3C4_9ACTN|nr:hypothetical protein [Streptomyces fodineus]AOR29940.1 hypothetical protein BFF78_01560 [Streptomyces fodineus]